MARIDLHLPVDAALGAVGADGPADTSPCSVSRSPMRRPCRHWRVIELSSFSAMFSQLPCFGV